MGGERGGPCNVLEDPGSGVSTKNSLSLIEPEELGVYEGLEKGKTIGGRASVVSDQGR